MAFVLQAFSRIVNISLCKFKRIDLDCRRALVAIKYTVWRRSLHCVMLVSSLFPPSPYCSVEAVNMLFDFLR